MAKAQGDTALAAQLEAEAQKANVDLLQQKVDNVKAYYNAELGLLDNRGQQIQNRMDLVDARGDILSTDYYDKLSNIEKQRQVTLNSELQNLEGKLSGFTKGTQEWYDLNNSIQETKNAIAQSQKQVYDNTTAAKELRDKVYELIHALPQNLADEYSFLGNLVRGENTDSDTGDFTDAGLAKLYAGYMGFSAVSSNIKTNRDRLNEVESIYDDYLLGRASESETLSKAGKLGYNSIKSLTQGIQEIRNKLQEDINNGKGYLDSIRDIVKDKMEAMVNYVSEIIEAHKEVLNQEKALYDYQRQMLEKTKTISNIEKQMAALRGDDSEEGRARLAKLQTQLDEANQDLKDTEYDKYISDQEDMLDQLLKEYSDLMELLQKDEDYMINHGFKEVNDNLIKMQEILNKIANAWSYPQSNDYKDSENDVKKDVEDGGISDYNPDNIITKPGQKEENKVTDTLDEKGKDYLDKLNGNSGNNNNNSGGNNNGGVWSGFLNKSDPYPDNDPDAEEHHKDRADTVDTGMASSGSFGAGKTVADEKRYVEQAQAAVAAANEKARQKNLNAARSFISANAQKAKKKRAELSYVNQRIYDATNGKVLSTENLKKLAKNTLKIEYDNAAKDGKLAKKLKEIRYSGFKTGGIAELMPKGEDGLAWVRNGEGFVSPEDVKHINKLLEVTPSMEQFVHAYDNIPKTTNVNNQVNYGDVSFNFELPNVVDRKDLLRTIQNDRGIQSAIKILAWQEPLGLNKYAVNTIR